MPTQNENYWWSRRTLNLWVIGIFLYTGGLQGSIFSGELGVQLWDLYRAEQEVNSVGRNLVGELILKIHRLVAWLHIQGGSKSKLLISSEYVNNNEKICGMWTNANSYRENGNIVWYFHLKYFTSQLFYVSVLYDWKQSMKLLLGKHELACVNVTS